MTQQLPKALQLKISALNRAIFLQDGDQAARAYEEVLAVEPTFTLRDPVQFQLAGLLESHEHPELALTAYAIGLQEGAILGRDRQEALLASGRLAARLGRADQAFVQLEQYLATSPPEEGRREATDLMRRLHGESSALPMPPTEDVSTEKLRAVAPDEPEDDDADETIHLPEEESGFASLPGEGVPEPEKVPPRSKRRSSAEVERPVDDERLTPETGVAKRQTPTPFPEAERRSSSGETMRMFRTPPPVPPDEETPEQRYNRLRDGEFALLLPLGKKIHLPAVAAFVAAEQGLNPEEARRRIMRQKGVLFDELKAHDVLSLKEGVEACNQSLLFVNIPRSLRPMERSQVFSLDFRPQGLRMNTSDGLKRLRWDDIRVISCGMLEGRAAVTLIGLHPTVEYELASDCFSFSAFKAPEENDELGIAGFLDLLRNHCRHAVISHTSLRLLEKRSRTPQVFATRDEYTYYTLYVLFSHFGEVVDTGELLQLHQAHSDW